MTRSEDLDRFFDGRPEARALFDAVQARIAALGVDGVRLRVTKSQVAFSRRRGFAWAWTPDRYLRGRTAPLVLSIALGRRDGSARWKEVVQPAPARWMHHLELTDAAQLDVEVDAWLSEAAAGAA
ncbi:MAG: DUF5655 domain-containing protein [Dehalococcoidia bacterium]